MLWFISTVNHGQRKRGRAVYMVCYKKKPESISMSKKEIKMGPSRNGENTGHSEYNMF